MRIGGVDVAVSQDSMKRFHRNSSRKRARVEVAPIENIDMITSSENESSSQSSSEFEQSSETEEECTGPSQLVSSDVCKLTDKKFVSSRSTSSILLEDSFSDEVIMFMFSIGATSTQAVVLTCSYINTSNSHATF